MCGAFANYAWPEIKTIQIRERHTVSGIKLNSLPPIPANLREWIVKGQRQLYLNVRSSYGPETRGDDFSL